MITKLVRRALLGAAVTLSLIPTTTPAQDPYATVKYEETLQAFTSADSVGGVSALGVRQTWPAIDVRNQASDAFIQVTAAGGIYHAYREYPMYYDWDDPTDTFTLTPVGQPVDGDFWMELGSGPGGAKFTPSVTMTREANDWTWPAGQATKNFTVRITLTATQDFIDTYHWMKLRPQPSWSPVPGITCEAVTFRDDAADLFYSTSMDGDRVSTISGHTSQMTSGTTYTLEFDFESERTDTTQAILFKPAFQLEYLPLDVNTYITNVSHLTVTGLDGVSITGHTEDTRDYFGKVANNTQTLIMKQYGHAIGSPVVDDTQFQRKTRISFSGDTFEEVVIYINGSNLVSGVLQTPTGANYQLWTNDDAVKMEWVSQDATLIGDFTPGTYDVTVTGSDGTTHSYQFTVNSFPLPTQSPELVTTAFDTGDTTPLIEWQPVTDPAVDYIDVSCYGQNDFYGDSFDDEATTLSWQLTAPLNVDGYLLTVGFHNYEPATDTYGRDVNLNFGQTALTYFNVIPGSEPEIAVEQPAGNNLSDGATVDFGVHSPGAASNLTFTIRNSGSGDLTGLTILKDGPDAAGFSITTSPAAPLAAGGSTTFTVEFAPAVSGVMTAAVHIASNDSDENPFDITLTGQAALEISGDGFLGVVPQSSGADRTDSGRLTAQSQGPAILTDGNTATRSTTFRPSGTTGAPTAPYFGALYDYAGMRFPTPQNAIFEIRVNPTVFGDGGWWISETLDVQVTTASVFSTTPLPADPNPNGSDSKIVEISTTDNIWTSVPYSSDYPADATVSSAGSVVSGSPYSFVLDSPQNNITAIRVIGNPAGNTSGSMNEGDLKFIAMSEIAVFGGTAPPEIVVEQPSGNNLTDGGFVDFGIAGTDDSEDLVFVVRNAGDDDLSGLAVSLSGADAEDFAVAASPAETLPPESNTTFTIRFTPATSGAKAALLQLSSNDADENPFDIGLSGRALATTDDTDGDGLNDLAEFRMNQLGFDWESTQPDLVSALLNNAGFANLYSENDLSNIFAAAPLIAVSNGTVTLELQMQKSDDLETWEDFSDSILWIDYVTGDQAFYRLFFDKP